jgi:hypothetical protein
MGKGSEKRPTKARAAQMGGAGRRAGWNQVRSFWPSTVTPIVKDGVVPAIVPT